MLLLALTLSASTRGVVMIYLLFFLVPIVALLAWAARLDWKRRRREISGHDINTATYNARQDAERKATEWTAGT
jgi:hypothetical protein